MQNDVTQLATELAKQLNTQSKEPQNFRNAGTVAVEINQRINQKAQEQHSFAVKIKKEMADKKNVSVLTIPRIYAEYQPSFTATVNGCTVNIPADGNPRIVHNIFATIILRRMKALDDKIANMRSFDNRELPH